MRQSLRLLYGPAVAEGGRAPCSPHSPSAGSVFTAGDLQRPGVGSAGSELTRRPCSDCARLGIFLFISCLGISKTFYLEDKK